MKRNENENNTYAKNQLNTNLNDKSINNITDKLKN